MAKTGFGCTPYQVRREVFIFDDKQSLELPWGNNSTVKSG